MRELLCKSDADVTGVREAPPQKEHSQEMWGEDLEAAMALANSVEAMSPPVSAPITQAGQKRKGRRPRSPPLQPNHLPAIANAVPAHCPLHVSKRHRCAFCARLKRSRQTRMYCPDCGVGLCIGEERGQSCFGLWHGLQVFQTRSSHSQ